jgi:hypothetical protein
MVFKGAAKESNKQVKVKTDVKAGPPLIVRDDF